MSRKRFASACLMALTLLSVWPPAALADGEVEVYNGFFPYEVHRRTLANGLDVLVIPMPEYKDVLSYNTLVLTGSRNEIEPGKTGLAHLFEHILFRHMWNDETNGYDHAMGEMGAFNNAYTWFDITYYHPVTFKANLEQLAELEADRFLKLNFTEKIFRTEAGAVMGEYRNGAANPGRKMDEELGRLMYGDHGYGHTTIGSLEDVKDMPNEYEAAVAFHSDWYRPNNSILLVTGDVQPNEIFALAEQRYGEWEAKDTPELPTVPPVDGPKRGHVDWEVDVPPRVSIAHRAPTACLPGSKDTAIGQLLPELLTSETAPLWQKLRSEKQTCSQLGLSAAVFESFDPGPIEIGATMYKEQYAERGDALIDEVIADILAGTEELKSFSKRPDASETLAALQKKLQYDMLAQIDSPANAAETFYWYYRFGRQIDCFDQLVKALESVTPEDIDAYAQAVFVPENRVIVTMSHEAGGAR